MTQSMLSETLAHICARSAAAVVARARLASPALNAALLRRLSARPGVEGSLLSEPVFEVASVWEQADQSLGDLAGGLLHPRLVDALEGAPSERITRDRHPYAHQLAAWKAARDGLSCLVTSGTGSGKTECFVVPILDDILRDEAKGQLAGVRAIVIYPLNALIESQRERLAAWTESLKDRITFALYNGLTPETPREIKRELGGAELGDRRTIRENPPSILITNVTMLEYLLLRAKDQPILERSQGLLRWIVLDEAHGYIGAQAAEMALLLRRVRAAFGVDPEQVRLMATSATISEGGKKETDHKLRGFVANLAGVGQDRVTVIEGREAEQKLPPAGADAPLDPTVLVPLSSQELWSRLACHPRVRRLRTAMKAQGLRLSEIGDLLFGNHESHEKIQDILDAAARAQDPDTGRRLLPWRAHLFHRAQGGIWACVDPACPRRDPELTAAGANWGFGAVWLAERDHCACGASAFEIVACTECGTPHLVAGRESGTLARLIPNRFSQGDEFMIDEEPDPEEENLPVARDTVWLRPARGMASDRHLSLADGTLYDNGAPKDIRAISIYVIERKEDCDCCANAARARLQPQRYGAPFFMGVVLPDVLERLAPPLAQPGLPMGGRRAITFSDSRQGVARLAAKLQQDAERTLARAFLYHSVQEEQGLSGEERAKLAAKLAKFRTAPELFAEEITQVEKRLAGEAKPIPWRDLINRLGAQHELGAFATKVWTERAWGGSDMADHPAKLAEMFLYRELFRRPRVQNNAETMGLVRLMFPAMETKARLDVPRALREAGVNAEGWAGLAQAAVDSVFRDSLAVCIDIGDASIVRWVGPRWGNLQSVTRFGLPSEDHPPGSRPWPGPNPHPANPSRLVLLVYRLIEGNPDDPIDQDRAREVLDALWALITTTATRDSGRGAWRLDFTKAAVARVEKGWLCPVTRRILGYTTGGPSPYGPEDERLLTPVAFPRLPHANAGGLGKQERESVARWCRADAGICDLRAQGLWTDLHDRIAIYPPFLRAQEHSAQIDRPVLQNYEERFKAGEINLLTCSTTMEMGVDIPNVALAVNANVPPSVSNYRQRVGRAGRRGEPWAFAMTFCRDLPLDHAVFQNPLSFLTARIAAPAVRLDSVPVVARHVHAALLAAFLRASSKGLDIKTSAGAFFGATEDVNAPVTEDNPADTFLIRLRDPDFVQAQTEDLSLLVRDTALKRREAAHLCAETAEAIEKLLQRWRGEHNELLERTAASVEEEVRQAFELRARRMRGEFLLSELARRSFTPSYGFPVDVVRFDHLSGRNRVAREGERIAFGEYRGGASRTLDVAIREYAPGAEVVIDGLVHESEGLLPAWSAMADDSKLEDLQVFWECKSCRGFGLSRSIRDTTCPQCGAPEPRLHNVLRPAGFLGRRAPHTGYESLRHVPFEMPKLAARTPWQALPDPGAGRLRADGEGQVITQSSGPHGMGYALCLCCGRAEAEEDELRSPKVLRDHKPLAPLRAEQLKKGACPGGLTQRARIKRNLRFVHETRTDVFEWQLPSGVAPAQALALAAGLRETLAERLGADAREIGLATSGSLGAAGQACVARLTEFDWLKACVLRAAEWLDCKKNCDHGCPDCILRPDLNFGDEFPDRPGAHLLAQDICRRLELPAELQVFGAETKFVGQPLLEWLDRRRLMGKLRALTFYLHGNPGGWELAAWHITGLLERASETGVRITLVLSSRALTDKGLEMAQKLDLYRLSARANLAHAPTLPTINGASLLAIAEIEMGLIGIAAADPAEVIPGPDWGLGQSVPLVYGPAGQPIASQIIAADRLVTLSAGNARLMRLQNELDGVAADFGTRSWKALETADPLTIAALRHNGVSETIYTDRYLLTPLNFSLLHEVLMAIPGRTTDMKLEISTAELDRPGQAGYLSFHPFSEDRQRQEVLRELFPHARIVISPKSKQPHARSLVLKINDGRRLQILLDQGFGAWRTEGPARHDFRLPPQKQAIEIKRADAHLRMGEKHGAPVIIEFV